MEWNPSWKSNSHLLREEIPRVGNRRFISMFARARHWSLSWARCIHFTPSLLSLRPIPVFLRFHNLNLIPIFLCLGRSKISVQIGGHVWCFVTSCYIRWGVVSPSSNPKLKYHPLSAVRAFLFSIFAATRCIWWPSLPFATEDSPCRDDTDPCNVYIHASTCNVI
jgi:hypothetical protein